MKHSIARPSNRSSHPRLRCTRSGAGVSDTTARKRRDEWLTAGVFDAVAQEATAAYNRVIGLDLSDVAVDGSLHKSPCGGEGGGVTAGSSTRPRSHDRAEESATLSKGR